MDVVGGREIARKPRLRYSLVPPTTCVYDTRVKRWCADSEREEQRSRWWGVLLLTRGGQAAPAVASIGRRSLAAGIRLVPIDPKFAICPARPLASEVKHSVGVRLSARQAFHVSLPEASHGRLKIASSRQ